jgi:hypothetical protein
MNAYLITWHESDGNDCTVYETIVEAVSEENALSVLAYQVEKMLNAKGVEYSDDGSEFGYYFECPDDCESLADAFDFEECGIHSGGIALRDVQKFNTVPEARADMCNYHTERSVTS